MSTIVAITSIILLSLGSWCYDNIALLMIWSCFLSLCCSCNSYLLSLCSFCCSFLLPSDLFGKFCYDLLSSLLAVNHKTVWYFIFITTSCYYSFLLLYLNLETLLLPNVQVIYKQRIFNNVSYKPNFNFRNKMHLS